jgi:hypothetical protein
LKSTRPKIVASCAASVPEDGGFDKATLRQSLPWKTHGTFPQKMVKQGDLTMKNGDLT